MNPFRAATYWTLLAAGACAVGGIPATAADPSRPATARQGATEFNRTIRPILSNNCFQCHGPDEKQRKAGLRLDTETGIFADLGGHAAVVRGNPEESELIRRVASSDPKKAMPPRKTGKKLTPQEIDLLKLW